MTPIEVMTLGQYIRIHPGELAGKEILVAQAPWEILILCTDKSYVKMVPAIDRADPTLNSRNLTMLDLQVLKQTDGATYRQYVMEREEALEVRSAANGERALKEAINRPSASTE